MGIETKKLVEITNLYRFCKKNRNFYATIGYYVTLAMNELDQFKYRYEDNKIYKYDTINSNFTQMLDDENIGFLQEKFKKTHQSYVNQGQVQVWSSCEP